MSTTLQRRLVAQQICIWLVALVAVAVYCRSASAAEVQWEPDSNMDGQLFPSLIISTATQRPDADDDPDPQVLGDEYGLLGVAITAPAAHAKVVVTLRENALMNTSTWSGELIESGTEYNIAPKINYKFAELRKVRQQVPLNVTFAVNVNGKPAGEKHETITVHSINDCPFAVDDAEETINDKPDEDAGGLARATGNGENNDNSESDSKDERDNSEGSTGETTDMGWMFAAYVNEGSPVVDTILKEALSSGGVDHFAGYQGGPDDVLHEVFAVWSALQKRGIHYSNITTTPGGSQLVYSQHVRFVEESLQNEQANCVDGSVLFCSILRKLGMRAFLVTQPSHMYMGVYLTRSGDDRIGLETTMIGAKVAADAEKVKTIPPLRSLQGSLAPKIRESDAWRSFERAVAEGTATLERDNAKLESEDPNYQVIDIDESRNEGIMPISSDGA